MNLLKALRLSSTPRLAFVGSGGKTTAMFQLARQLLSAGSVSVILTTTTHLAVGQMDLADQCYGLAGANGFADFEVGIPPGISFFYGRKQGDRVAGLDSELFEALSALAEKHQAPLLIEADGSRQLPLKAPGEHEPAIPISFTGENDSSFRTPAWLDCVVVTAGLSGLGKPLNSSWVHRPQVFSNLSGLEMEEIITIDGLARVLSHPLGGLKNIPAGVRRVALLNQADTPALQSAGGHLSLRLLENGYHAVLLAALQPSNAERTVPALSGESGLVGTSEVFLAREPVAGIILAAGASSRFGQPKPLLTWRGETFIHRIARCALDAGLSPVILVSGANSDGVQRAVADLPVTHVFNPDWPSGQSSSLVAGLRNLPDQTGGVIFLLSDQPQIPVALLSSLRDRHSETLAAILAPLVDGTRATPVLFDRSTFADLMGLKGDLGGRALFSRYLVSWLPWHDPSLLLDIDRPEDYQKLLAMDGLE